LDFNNLITSALPIRKLLVGRQKELKMTIKEIKEKIAKKVEAIQKVSFEPVNIYKQIVDYWFNEEVKKETEND